MLQILSPVARFIKGILNCELRAIFFGSFWFLGAGIHKLELKINSAYQLLLGHSICSPTYRLWLHPYTAEEGGAL